MRKVTPRRLTARQLEIKQAFTDGRLHLLIDEPRPRGTVQIAFVGSRHIPHVGGGGEPVMIRHIHVMSKPAGCEIRGFIIANDGKLRLTLPCHAAAWNGSATELDEAVMMRVIGAVSVEPYAIDDEGTARPGDVNA